MKIAIIFHSQSGNTQKVAEVIAEGARSTQSEVRVMALDAVDADFVAEAGAVIFGCPTYCGSFSWQMKRFLDETKLNLDGKIGSVFVTENYIGGGADFAELSLIGCLLVQGMLCYSAGVSKGQPYTHFGAVALRSGDEAQLKRAWLLGQRVAEKASQFLLTAPA